MYLLLFYCCDKAPWQRKLDKDGVYVGCGNSGLESMVLEWRQESAHMEAEAELSHGLPISRKQRALPRNVTVASLYTFKASYISILPCMRSHVHQPKQHHQMNDVFKLPESIRDIFIKTTTMY